MNKSNIEQKRLETVVMLARLYGIRETLEELPYVEEQEVIAMIKEWTEEYLDTENEDIVSFFESKI